MDARQCSHNRGQIVAKQPPIVIGAKARNGVMVIFVAKNDALNGAFQCRHTQLFHPGRARPEIPFHISTVMGERRVSTTCRRLHTVPAPCSPSYYDFSLSKSALSSFASLRMTAHCRPWS